MEYKLSYEEAEHIWNKMDNYANELEHIISNCPKISENIAIAKIRQTIKSLRAHAKCIRTWYNDGTFDYGGTYTKSDDMLDSWLDDIVEEMKDKPVLLPNALTEEDKELIRKDFEEHGLTTNEKGIILGTPGFGWNFHYDENGNLIDKEIMQKFEQEKDRINKEACSYLDEIYENDKNMDVLSKSEID